MWTCAQHATPGVPVVRGAAALRAAGARPAAALVIQGSACVYSRKVEYLHTLVHQALAHVADKRCARARPPPGPG